MSVTGRLAGSTLCMMLAIGVASAAPAPPPIRTLAGIYDFDVAKTKLSPDGKLLAIAVPLGDRTGLATLRLADMSRVGVMQAGAGVHVSDIDWIASDRLVFSLAAGGGKRDVPVATGELYIVNADGSDSEVLVGTRIGEDGSEATRAETRERDWISASLIAPVRDDPSAILVRTWRNDGDTGTTQVDRLDVRDRSRRMLATVPLRHARFWLDHAQRVRLAYGLTDDNDSRLLHRANDGAEWSVVNDEAMSGIDMTPIGFSADDTVAYVLRDAPTGTTAVHALDPVTFATTEVARDAHSDPRAILISPFDGSPFGMVVAAGVPRAVYFAPESADARLHRSVQAAFPGQVVRLAGGSTDRRMALLGVSGDRNPGEMYTFDTSTRQARYLAAANSALAANALGARQPIAFDASDGQRIHGYLTLPPGSDGRGLPMIVMPHGGPFGIHTEWDYDPDVQMLATRGYAVLEPDFRGSGGYGRAFQEAGYKQWGRRMQDDVSDATRWAIAQGIAAPERICIHGSSYGAYAALMGVVREPDLYRCASGNIGVYDLKAMQEVGDIAAETWGRKYLRDVIDMERAPLDSPVQHAATIRVPVLLSAGRNDERAPAVHTERMRDALREAGVPVDAKIYWNEGHGYVLANNVGDYYARLLEFFDKHIGDDARAARAKRRR